MNYNLHFHPLALREWNKLSPNIKCEFKKILKIRLIEPKIKSCLLKGNLKNCYKIKLRTLGYRLVYKVKNKELIVLVLAIGKRDKNKSYIETNKRK